MSTSNASRSTLLAVCAAIGIVLLGWAVGGGGTVAFIRFGPEVVFHEDFPFWSDVAVYTVTALFTAWAALLATRLLRRAGRGRAIAAVIAVLMTMFINVLLNVQFLVSSDETRTALVVLGANLAGALLGAVAGSVTEARSRGAVDSRSRGY